MFESYCQHVKHWHFGVQTVPTYHPKGPVFNKLGMRLKIQNFPYKWGKKYFWATVHHVITQFGHYENCLPGRLAQDQLTLDANVPHSPNVSVWTVTWNQLPVGGKNQQVIFLSSTLRIFDIHVCQLAAIFSPLLAYYCITLHVRANFHWISVTVAVEMWCIFVFVCAQYK